MDANPFTYVDMMNKKGNLKIMYTTAKCKPGFECCHNTQNHMFHGQEDLNQRILQLQKEFHHM